MSTLIELPARKRVFLAAEQHRPDALSFAHRLDVDFGTSRGQWDGCTRHTLGSCWYYDCPVGSNPVGTTAGNDPLVDSPGTVVAATAGGTINLLERVPGTYQANGEGQIWPSAGGSISFSVSGGSGVPALDVQILAPPFVSLTSLNGEAAPAVIKRSDGAKVEWTSSGRGTVFFGIYAYSGVRPGAFCFFDAAAAAGTMPAAVLEKVDPGTTYSYDLRGDVRGTVSVGEWEIESYGSGYSGTSATFSAIALQ